MHVIPEPLQIYIANILAVHRILVVFARVVGVSRWCLYVTFGGFAESALSLSDRMIVVAPYELKF